MTKYRRNQSIEAFGIDTGIYFCGAVLRISRVRYTVYIYIYSPGHTCSHPARCQEIAAH